MKSMTNKNTVSACAAQAIHAAAAAGAVFCAVMLTSLSGASVRVVLGNTPGFAYARVLMTMLTVFGGCTALCVFTAAAARKLKQ